MGKGGIVSIEQARGSLFSYEEVEEILRNVGIDATCGACASIAFIGSAPNLPHTCKNTPRIAIELELDADYIARQDRGDFDNV
jgi:hypothetical protein